MCTWFFLYYGIPQNPVQIGVLAQFRIQIFLKDMKTAICSEDRKDYFKDIIAKAKILVKDKDPKQRY